MYDEEKLLLNKRDTIITVMDTNMDMHESFQIGDRVVFYRLFMDTYGKNGRNKSLYLDERQLTLQYKSKRSQYDNLRQLGISSDNDRQIGKSRVENPVSFDKLFVKLEHTYEKIKSLDDDEKVKIIKQDVKLHEVSLVGLILKISANETEHSGNLYCIKKIYLLLPKHHLMILNISDPYFYSKNSFPKENTLVLLDCIYFQELVDLNTSDKSISPISMLECERWIHSKTLYENNTAYVLSFNTSNQTNIIPEKILLSKYADEVLYSEDIKRLKRLIDTNDAIIKRRCEEIGIITQSVAPIFNRDFKQQPKIFTAPSNSFKIAAKSSSFNIGKNNETEDNEINIEIKPQQIRQRAKFKPININSNKFTLKRRKIKEISKAQEEKVAIEDQNKNYNKNKNENNEDKESDAEFIDEIPKSQEIISQNQLDQQSHNSEHTPPLNNDDSVIILNEDFSFINKNYAPIVQEKSSNFECRSEGDKSNHSLITFCAKENSQEDCVYSDPKLKIIKSKGKCMRKSKVVINVTKSNQSDEVISVNSINSNPKIISSINKDQKNLL